LKEVKAMSEGIPTPKVNRTLRAPLSVVGVLLAATLTAGVLINHPESVSPNGSSHSTHATNGVVSLASRTSQGAVLVGSDGLVQVELVLAAEEGKRERSASGPGDLVVVLDRSGSMAGEKIDYARAAVLELVHQLGVQDRFALVTYSTDAEIRIPLSLATAGARSAWSHQVRSIGPSGHTNMSAGLDLAYQVISSSGPSSGAEGRFARVVLISDGLANHGDSSSEGLSMRARRIAEREDVLSTVGVGADFNEYLMSALADSGTGNYYFLESAHGLAEIFAKEFEATRATVATAVAVTLEPGEGVEVVEAAGYPLERHVRQGRQLVFRPGTLFSGQERRLWVTYRIPASEPGEFELGKIGVTYKDGGREFHLGLDDVPKVACVRNEETFFASVDKETWEDSVVGEYYNRLQEEVAKDVREGRVEDAKAKIHSYRERQDSLNRVLKSATVERNLGDVDALAQEVEEAFRGPEQDEKRNEFSKTRQQAGRDGRRAGSKR
jgi:Ca-activated chloride channel family protein